MSETPKCRVCGFSKEDLVHPENWGEHQMEMERNNPGILKSAIPNAHAYVPSPIEAPLPAAGPWCKDMGKAPDHGPVLWFFDSGNCAVFDSYRRKPDCDGVYGKPTAWAEIHPPKG